MADETKVRYSDGELLEFKAIIDERLAKAQQELDFTQQQIAELNENGFNQQGGDWNDDASIHTDLEFLQRMAQRQLRLVQDLANALLRVQNKTYGICTVTGQLIDKERLRVVPHTTKTIDGKNLSNANKPNIPTDASPDPFGNIDDLEKPAIKPVSDKVRINNVSGNTASEDWEPDNEQIEDASYNQNFDDDDEA